MTPKATRCAELGEIHPMARQTAVWTVQGFTPPECAALSGRTDPPRVAYKPFPLETP